MRYRRIGTLSFVVLLIGVVVLPLLPSASAEPGGRTDWAARIQEMDGAVARGDAPAVSATWREAYVAAHVSRTWAGMIAVGDAALRAGRETGTPDVFAPRARRAYLTAFLRARRMASSEGMVAAAEAFARLGDRDAERLARDEAAKLTVPAVSDARRRTRSL